MQEELDGAMDGIVGDVGHGVIRDRRVLGEEGVVVVVVTVDIQTGKVLVGPEIITRGWVYAPEAEDLLDEACDTVADAVEASLGDVRLARPDWIEFDESNKTATVKELPKVDSVPFPLEIDLVIEYYSKRL
mgnify:CR=1 FL=1